MMSEDTSLGNTKETQAREKVIIVYDFCLAVHTSPINEHEGLGAGQHCTEREFQSNHD